MINPVRIVKLNEHAWQGPPASVQEIAEKVNELVERFNMLVQDCAAMEQTVNRHTAEVGFIPGIRHNLFQLTGDLGEISKQFEAIREEYPA